MDAVMNGCYLWVVLTRWGKEMEAVNEALERLITTERVVNQLLHLHPFRFEET